jgi:cell division protein FtsI (penicillin-binding protein 3)
MRKMKRALLPFVLVIAACGSGSSASPPSAPANASASIDVVLREELDRGAAQLSPNYAVAIALDATTGAVIAVEGRDHGRSDPTIATQHAVITGSTLKPILYAAAFDAGTIAPTATVDCAPRQYQGGTFHDASLHGVLSLTDALAVSSNVGASRVFDTLGLAPWYAAVKRFHIGDAPAALPTVTDASSGAAAAFAAGELAKATPMQMAKAYVALFHDGVYPGAPEERVIKSETAAVVVKMLAATIASDIGTGKGARIEGARVAGKTGTGDLESDGSYASFIGTVLDRQPHVVILVGYEGKHDGMTGSSSAAPVFAKIARRTLH